MHLAWRPVTERPPGAKGFNNFNEITRKLSFLVDAFLYLLTRLEPFFVRHLPSGEVVSI